MQQATITQEYQSYIKLAETGHYPLFFDNWLNESIDNEQRVNFNHARKNVKSVFSKLAKHRTLDKKKTALIGMDKEQREEFIRSFLKVVEHQLLKETKTLQ